jgi:hypothetical protein
MTHMFRRVTLAVAGLGLCLAFVPAGQAQARTHVPRGRCGCRATTSPR